MEIEVEEGQSTSWWRQAQITILAALPGLTLFFFMWLVTYRQVAFHLIAERAFGWWQSLGRQILEVDGWVAVSHLHIQPPGFSILQLLDLQVTPYSHTLLGVSFAGMTMLCLVLIVDTVRAFGTTLAWAGVTGVIFALLPATLAYALWPFSTVPTMLAGALILWGASRLACSRLLGALGIALGGLWGFLNRPTYTWFLIVGIFLGVSLWLFLRNRSTRDLWPAVSVLLVAAFAVLGVQLHYWNSFGLVSTSSWTGENIVKALTQSGEISIDENAAKNFAPGSCEANVVEAIRAGAWLVWQPAELSAVPGCDQLAPLPETGVLALDSPAKDGQDDGAWIGNFNWSLRLAHSKVWNDVAIAIVREDPLQVARMAFLGPTSGFGITMRPAHELEGEFTELVQQGPVHWLLAPLAALIAPLAFALVVIAWPFAWRFHRANRSLMAVFWIGTVLLLSLTMLSLVEFGENQRFQQEMLPILLVLIVASIKAIGTRVCKVDHLEGIGPSSREKT